MGLHRDPRSLPKQPSELVNAVQMPDRSTNKDQGARNGTVFASKLGMLWSVVRTVLPATLDFGLCNTSYFVHKRHLHTAHSCFSCVCCGMVFPVVKFTIDTSILFVPASLVCCGMVLLPLCVVALVFPVVKFTRDTSILFVPVSLACCGVVFPVIMYYLVFLSCFLFVLPAVVCGKWVLLLEM
jgi:hypothetical protein